MLAGVDAIVREVALRIDAELPTLTAEMTALFVEVISEFRHDDAARRLMVASTSSNLTTIVHMLAHGIPLDQVDVPPAAAEYARRFAQQDLSLEALLRAYRLGEHRFVQCALRHLGDLELTADDVLAVAGQVSLRLNGYIDQVIEGLIDIYEEERRRWDRRSDAARTAQVRAVLETEGLDAGTAEEMLGVPLRGWNLAAVAWVETLGPGAGRDLRATGRLLAEASDRQPVTMLADDHTVWAWLTSAGSPSLDRQALRALLADHPHLRIALGEPGTGLAGFRGSHREARRARTIAESAAHPEQLVDFGEVAVVGLLTDDVNDLRTWVCRTLGALARDDEAMARLRETVRVFLHAGGSFTDAASQLHLHKNTVHYRVRKAEEILGRPLTERRLDTEVALLATELLGRRVIVPAPA
jgi:hypothetical protein